MKAKICTPKTLGMFTLADEKYPMPKSAIGKSPQATSELVGPW